MSNSAKEISDIFDNLLSHGYRALTGVNRDNEHFEILVHQNGTEILHNNVAGYRNPLLETRPIMIAGGAGKIALTFTTTAETDSLLIAETLKHRHASDVKIPIVQSAPHAGTLVHYPSGLTTLASHYLRDTVRIDAGIRLSNLDIEPVVREAVEVGGLCLLDFETAGFSQVLLNSARSLERLASES